MAKAVVKKRTKIKLTPSYWAVFEGKNKIYRGAFLECWNYLVSKYSNRTLKSLVKAGVRVGRAR